jgi:hypothetical protein
MLLFDDVLLLVMLRDDAPFAAKAMLRIILLP